MSALRFFSRLPLVLLCACALDVSEPALGEHSAPLSARDEVLRLTLTTPEVTSDGVLLTGRTSRALSTAMAFVPDDEVGQTALLADGFETRLPLAEVNARLTGSPLLFSLVTDQGVQTHARARFGLSLPASCSTAKLSFDRAFSSAVVDGVSVLRFTGHTSVWNGKVEASLVRERAPSPSFRGHRTRDVFWIDVPVDLATTAALTGTPIRFTASADGSTVTRSCTPRVVLTSLELSTDNPYDVWPTPACDDSTRACLALPENRWDTAACGDVATVRSCGARAQPTLCGASISRKLEGTVQGSLWMSESDRPFTRVLLADEADASVSDALRAALATPADALVETRNLDDVLSWPTQDQPEEGEGARIQASVYRVLRQQLVSYLDDVQVVRIGEIEIRVYFVGRDACGNLVGLETVAIET